MSRLDNLVQYQNFRRIGNTTLMMRGVSFDRPAIIMFDSLHSARRMFDDYKVGFRSEDTNPFDLRLGNVFFKSISMLDNLDWAHGHRPEKMMPIIIDHFAMQILIQEDRDERESKTRDSERNHIFSVLRHAGVEFDRKAVMKLHNEWVALAKKETERKRGL